MEGLKRLFVIFLTGFVFSASATVAPFNDTLTRPEGAQRLASKPAFRTIVIDAGHGGHDHGCLGASSKEKHLALDLALSLGGLIEARQPDVEVIYTRDSDVFVPLHKRASIANKAKADLFLSIHCNYLVGSSKVNGSETYVMGLHTAEQNLNVAKRENAAIKLEQNVDQNYDFDPDSPTGHIILSMFQHAHLEESLFFASDIEEQLSKRSGRKSRGVKQAGFVVLKETAMPSVLVETGYLSNREEETYLAGTDGQLETAEALYKGFIQYLRRQRINLGERAAQLTNRHYPPLSTSDKQLTIEDYSEPEILRTTVGPASVLPNTPTSTESEKEKEKVIPTKNYYVQLAASKRQIEADDPMWISLDSPVRYIREGEYYKYQMGPFTDKTSTGTALTSARTTGFPDAFIVAYLSDKKVPVE